MAQLFNKKAEAHAITGGKRAPDTDSSAEKV